MRKPDGSAGDANYGAIGGGYTRWRQPDPQIAKRLHAALGAASNVLNVGAGAGSYEPTDRVVTPVEPSATMRAQRPAALAQAVDATAEDLPFDDGAFDAAMASFTVHQWTDLARGLGETRRVTRGPIVILTCLPDAVQRFWLNDYAPEVLATEARRYPSPDTIAAALGERVRVEPVPIPFDCRDGFNEAYFGRPETLLDPGARQANSAWSFVPADLAACYVDALSEALCSGSWDAAYGSLRNQPEYEGSLCLIVADGR
ncbi:methyltransferase domain-containing protein [Paracoccus caeni]|uniref:Methyltransferase domain-containing protein n=1 Tax=Paracoccus caeni TaxID=657651 RepID=A0A934SF25_9RHOB|nr:class I SAM-dependent methyltransferase [Paracoccus caeni]MBK4216702.1 methyltransferase domain-containing protein [Paracoccus caeni]